MFKLWFFNFIINCYIISPINIVIANPITNPPGENVKIPNINPIITAVIKSSCAFESHCTKEAYIKTIIIKIIAPIIIYIRF